MRENRTEHEGQSREYKKAKKALFLSGWYFPWVACCNIYPSLYLLQLLAQARHMANAPSGSAEFIYIFMGEKRMPYSHGSILCQWRELRSEFVFLGSGQHSHSPWITGIRSSARLFLHQPESKCKPFSSLPWETLTASLVIPLTCLVLLLST